MCIRDSYEPLRHPKAPGLCRHRRPVGRPRPRQGASRVARAFLVYVLSPLPRHSHWRYCSAHPSSDVSLPRNGCRVGLCIDLFEACSAFTHVTARTLALPPIRGSLIRRLQPLRYLHSCSGCFRLERLPGGARTRWKAPPFHGARQLESVVADSFPASQRGCAALWCVSSRQHFALR